MSSKNKDINSVVNNNMANLLNARPNMDASSPNKKKEYSSSSVGGGSSIPAPSGSVKKPPPPLYPMPDDSEEESNEFQFEKPSADQKKDPLLNNNSLPIVPSAPGGGGGGGDDDEEDKKMAAKPSKKMSMEEKIQAKIRQDNASRKQPQPQQQQQQGESFLNRPDRIQAMGSKGTANTGTTEPGVQFYSAPTNGPLAQVETVQTARPQETANTEPKNQREERVKYYTKYGAIGCGILVIIVLVVVLITVLGGGNDDNSNAGAGNDAAGTSMQEPSATELFVRQWLPQSTLEAVEVGSTPQAQAFGWMTSDSSLMERNYTRKQLQQRFAMATFYYSTGGQSWENNDLWLSKDHHECQWYSFFESFDENQYPCGREVTENTQHVGLKHLSLKENGLVGQLPLEISWLTSLSSISLPTNELSGTIPPELEELTQLTEIDFTQNSLTGKIPSTLGNLPNLSELYLEFNKLTGVVPGNLNDAPLMFLYINNNDLVGRVPGSLCEDARVESDCDNGFCGCDCANC